MLLGSAVVRSLGYRFQACVGFPGFLARFPSARLFQTRGFLNIPAERVPMTQRMRQDCSWAKDSTERQDHDSETTFCQLSNQKMWFSNRMIKTIRPQQLNKGLNPPDPWNKYHNTLPVLTFALPKQCWLTNHFFWFRHGYETRFPKDKFLKKVQEGTKLQIPKDMICFKKKSGWLQKGSKHKVPKRKLDVQCTTMHRCTNKYTIHCFWGYFFSFRWSWQLPAVTDHETILVEGSFPEVSLLCDVQTTCHAAALESILQKQCCLLCLVLSWILGQVFAMETILGVLRMPML